MDAETTVLAYYDALRAGDPLYPFFAREETTVKFGIGERLTGYAEVQSGLADQTATTTDWSIDSERLIVGERKKHAWFSDDVEMAWTDQTEDLHYEYSTRWSGTLERRPDESWAADGDAPTPWRFLGMHVSTPGGSE